MPALPPLIHDKSRMRRRACTDLCGGRSAMVVPTATVANILGEGATGKTAIFGATLEQPKKGFKLVSATEAAT